MTTPPIDEIAGVIKQALIDDCWLGHTEELERWHIDKLSDVAAAAALKSMAPLVARVRELERQAMPLESDADGETIRAAKWEQRAKALWMRYHGAPLADDSDETWDAALTVRQD